MQQHVVTAALELPPELFDCRPATSFVEHDKFDTIDPAEQAVFRFSDDPGDFGLRPVGADGMDNRQDMGGVPQR